MQKQEEQTILRRQRLQDCKGESHTLDIAAGNLLLLDGHHTTIELAEQSAGIIFVGGHGTVCCTVQAFWHALAGDQAQPTVEEAGLLAAVVLILSEHLRQWRQVGEAVNQQTCSLLERKLPGLSLPQPRLDPFTEEVLARCPERLSLEHLHTIASLIGRDASEAHMLLADRGKSIIWPVQAEQQGDRPERAALEASFREEVPARCQPVSGEPGEYSSSKRTFFRWTEETIAQLKAAYCPTPDQTIDEQARTIAHQYGWPWRSVRYKIFQLHLTSQDAGGRQVPGDGQGAVILSPGAFLWDVKDEGGMLHRWRLDYPYGQFPLPVGSLCTYQECTYRLLSVNTSVLMVRQVVPDQLEVHEQLLQAETIQAIA